MGGAEWINLAHTRHQRLALVTRVLFARDLAWLLLASPEVSSSRHPITPTAADSTRYHFNAFALTRVVCLKSERAASKKAKTRHFLCGSQQDQMTVLKAREN